MQALLRAPDRHYALVEKLVVTGEACMATEERMTVYDSTSRHTHASVESANQEWSDRLLVVRALHSPPLDCAVQMCARASLLSALPQPLSHGQNADDAIEEEYAAHLRTAHQLKVAHANIAYLQSLLQSAHQHIGYQQSQMQSLQAAHAVLRNQGAL